MFDYKQDHSSRKGHLIYHGLAISTVHQYSGLSINQTYHGLMHTKNNLREPRQKFLRIVA
jgi:hypothetical protein